MKEGEFVTLDDDLAGFWDMVCLQIDDIDKMFNKLHELKSNNWNTLSIVPVKTEDKKKQIKTGTISSNAKTSIIANKSINSTKARSDAARQRLLEAKKNALKQKETLKNSDPSNFKDDSNIVIDTNTNN